MAFDYDQHTHIAVQGPSNNDVSIVICPTGEGYLPEDLIPLPQGFSGFSEGAQQEIVVHARAYMLAVQRIRRDEQNAAE